MTTAREEIIGSIRRNLATSALFDEIRREHRGNDFAGTTSATVTTEHDVVENFRDSLDLLGTHYLFADSEKHAAKYVEVVIAKLGAKKIAVSNSDVVKHVLEMITGNDFIENAPKDVLFDCDLGITSAQWAIAETGTLVLESEKESHRLTSLVPAVHLCILKASRIRQTLGEILELTNKDLSRTMTFITGASRTSDIELTLAIGVHGPGELHVIVIADQ